MLVIGSSHRQMMALTPRRVQIFDIELQIAALTCMSGLKVASVYRSTSNSIVPSVKA
jgi:hypothetical protein